MSNSGYQYEHSCLNRSLLQGSPIDAARHLLGARLVTSDSGSISDGGIVADSGIDAVVTEVEAYGGPADSPWPDPAAHCYPGLTHRNRAMFGEAGHWYVYQSYGIHKCLNITCCADGIGGGVLIRSLRILNGEESVRSRRGERPSSAALARGPGNVGQALGVTLADYGADALDPASRMYILPPALGLSDIYSDSSSPRAQTINAGPRVGVRRASERTWRLWLDDETVSTYRRHAKASGEY